MVGSMQTSIRAAVAEQMREKSYSENSPCVYYRGYLCRCARPLCPYRIEADGCSCNGRVGKVGMRHYTRKGPIDEEQEN